MTLNAPTTSKFFVISKGRPRNVAPMHALFTGTGVTPTWIVGEGETAAYRAAGAKKVGVPIKPQSSPGDERGLNLCNAFGIELSTTSHFRVMSSHSVLFTHFRSLRAADSVLRAT